MNYAKFIKEDYQSCMSWSTDAFPVAWINTYGFKLPGYEWGLDFPVGKPKNNHYILSGLKSRD